MELQSPHTAVLGKAPRHPEFVRYNAASPLARYLLRWLEDGTGRLHAARSSLEGAPTCFVFTAPGEKTALVGVLTPSTDSIGRAFPLALFQEVPTATVAGRYALLPEAFQPFFLAATRLVREAASLELEALQARAQELPSVSAADTRVAERVREVLLAEPRCDELLRNASGGGSPEVRYYALHTFLTACAGERQRERDLASVVLDCPFPAHMGPVLWLELSARLLRWSAAPPSFFWSEGEQPRLLLCLGAAPSTLLLHLAQPGRASANLWPLRTERPAALARAKQALSPAQRRVIDSPSSTLENLLRAFAQ
ncbi:MAG TPA: type VI secretion system-associated protein TagF [Myxococcaceae bacterium]|nr:type VI secretion system-associated protein TagF [Myxococcaceae bacterium]